MHFRLPISIPIRPQKAKLHHKNSLAFSFLAIRGRPESLRVSLSESLVERLEVAVMLSILLLVTVLAGAVTARSVHPGFEGRLSLEMLLLLLLVGLLGGLCLTGEPLRDALPSAGRVNEEVTGRPFLPGSAPEWH